MTICDNLRYVAYAAAHGRDPENQLLQDEVDWPGGKMTGYFLWNRAQMFLFGAERPDAFYHFTRIGSNDMGDLRPAALLDHVAYNQWLMKKYPSNRYPVANLIQGSEA